MNIPGIAVFSLVGRIPASRRADIEAHNVIPAHRGIVLLGVRVVPSLLRRAARTRLMAAAVAVLAIVSAGSIASASSASASSYATISGAGSTWPQNAIYTWVNDEAQVGLHVNYAGVGSTTGRDDFKQGSVNFAGSDIPYGVQDGPNVDPPPTRGFAYVPDVAGGVAFMYNLTIGGQRVTNLRLSGAVIAGIFTGQITMWNDPKIAADNPDIALPAIAIIPVVRIDGSGGTWAFTQWMAATQGPAWTAYCTVTGRTPCTATSAYPISSADIAMVGQAGDTGVSNYVGQNASNGAIGYTEYSYAIQSGIPVAKVLNAAGYYTAPTPYNVGVSLLDAQANSDGTANLASVYTDADPRTYELSYYSYMIVPTDTSFLLNANQGYSLGAFGSFFLCQGQQQVGNLGYAALPINLVEDGYAQLQKIPGATLPASSAFLQGCANPTISGSGTDNLSSSAPMPPACDQQGPTQCTTTTNNTAVATITKLTVSDSSPAVGESVALIAFVSPVSGTNPPTGTVQFEVGGSLIGSPIAVDPSTLGVSSAITGETFATLGSYALTAVFTPADPTAFAPSVGSVGVTVGPSIGTTVTVTVPPSGAFAFTAPTTSTIAMTENGNTATGVMNPITITDDRNTYPGWSVLGQATDFTSPTSHPAGDISGNQLGWAPNATPIASGVVLGPVVSPAAPGLGTTAAVLASASAGGGFGTSTLGADLTLAIPPTAPSGAYSSVLTLTANPAGA
jgi:phosphate ABC transporter phosphate-binding protein